MTIVDLHKPKILSKNLFPVVGIGASAGGLEAFKKLVKAIPENSGMAYIFVQHLHPDHNSSLPQILQRETALPVLEIRDNVKVEMDQIYIIPSNKMLVATDGVLQLSPRPSKEQNMPIDIFFSSLAEVHESHAIGIVLSGSGVDGTAGLKSIKNSGGLTFAQDLESAAYDSMPQSAIAADVVDFIMAPEKMPQQLLELNQTYISVLSNDSQATEKTKEAECFKAILAILRNSHGVDFTYYRQTTIRRRILRRMVILKVDNLEAYLATLQESKTEQDLLFYDILIPVTSFFRDPQTFEYLCETALPELVKDKSSVEPLRIWVAGCSTGKEAYSIGMCLYEYLSDKISTIKIQIFATDISDRCITTARIGLYTKAELAGVSTARLKQFFIKTNGSYQIKKTIRDMCVFAKHNFLKDPPFAKLDLISCRNVLIYMEPFLQKKAFSTFHYALNDRGFLFLGKSETVGSTSEYFLPLGKNEKLFTKKSFGGKYVSVAASRGLEEKYIEKDYGIHSTAKKTDDIQKSTDDLLLSKYTPAGVVVNDQLDIIQFRGETEEFFAPSPGKASLNILKMSRDGLAFELRNALHQSKSSKKPFIKEGIFLNNIKRSITIEVIPIPYTIEPHYLVLLRDTQPIKQMGKAHRKSVAANIRDEKDRRIQQLENDLLQAKDEMSNIAHDQETANEELQSANEELLSGSEELQSLNEELETSKEELQSTNEEMITVNQELFERNEQLDQARLYSEAVVGTIHEPLLVLGKDFKIISANNSFYRNFSMTEENVIGKVIFQLQNNQWDIPGLRSQLLRIQKGNEQFLEWQVTYKFPTIGPRTICFNAQPVQKENAENWVLLAFNDITTQIQIAEAEKKHADNLTKVLDNLPQITLTFSATGAITYANAFFLDFAGVTLEESQQQDWKNLIKPVMRPNAKSYWDDSMTTGKPFDMELMLRRNCDNIYRWHLCRATAIKNDEGLITSWVAAAIDIHDQKTKEESKDEFMTIASHELKTPLTSAKAYVQLLQLTMDENNTEGLVYAKRAGASIITLNNLIEDLLDVSKIQNGKLSLEISSFDFNEMISDAIEGVQVTSPQHRLVQTGDIMHEVMGDKDRLQQVVINLLGNAVKYSPTANEVFVNLNEEDGKITVSVKDKGIGINKNNFQKIFERYFREEKRATHFQGLGIGLYICNDIIQRHQGKLWVESESGKGSTFYFTIPVKL